ncbi:MAG TPA: hypothetical protein ENN84_06805 [Candidatus Marinimicrobia bacterium]|nr:hypothetical protein [Candidatus Neomarinimicrobiota bacterium]
MSVSPIQRMSAIILMIAIVIWFFKTTSRQFAPDEPLIAAPELTFRTKAPDFDRMYLENVLKLKVRESSNDGIYFKNGIVLTAVHKTYTFSDTLSIQTARLLDAWKEILASPATIVHPPLLKAKRLTACFILPGGQPVFLVEISK